jgi:hypothetical protein
MATGDWIAFAAAVVAALSCVVAVVAYRLQRRTQAATDEQQLNDLIEKIETGLASLGKVRQDATPQSLRASGVALTSLRGHALEARKLIRRADITPDWFQCAVLAYAFSQTLDIASAGPFWKAAVDTSKRDADHPAHIVSLTARADFYYNRGLGDDWQLARQDFADAYAELSGDPDGQGPDLVNEQLATMRVQQGSFELDAEGEQAAMPHFVEAFVRAASIKATWRKRNVLKTLLSLTLELQQTGACAELLDEVKAKFAAQHISLDDLPADISAALSMPADGSAFAAQPAGSASTGSLSEPGKQLG